jgi:hypothetical protein
MSLIMDAMDATKCFIPHYHAKTKAWDKVERIGSQFYGFINHGVGTRIFVFDDELRKDANLSATLLVKVLMDEKKRREEAGIKWPDVLYLQMDNGSDNKNKEVSALGELVVRIGLFRKVKYSYLPVGHTHEDIDACFGACSNALHRCDALTIKEVETVCKRGWPSLKSLDYINVRSSMSLTFVLNF